MQVQAATLKALVQGEKQFQVPIWQRQYTWKTEQLAQLWDDLIEQYRVVTANQADRVRQLEPLGKEEVAIIAVAPRVDVAWLGVDVDVELLSRPQLEALVEKVDIERLRQTDKAFETFAQLLERHLPSEFASGECAGPSRDQQ